MDVKKTEIEQELEKRRTLQFNVLRRFMGDEEIKAFLNKYEENKTGGYGTNRKDSLIRELTPIDKKILRKYLFETDKNLREIAQEVDLKLSQVYSKASKVALRLLYQNIDNFDLEKLLK